MRPRILQRQHRQRRLPQRIVRVELRILRLRLPQDERTVLLLALEKGLDALPDGSLNAFERDLGRGCGGGAEGNGEDCEGDTSHPMKKRSLSASTGSIRRRRKSI